MRPVLQQLSPRGVGARRCVGYHQQPGRPTGVQPQKHLQQRLLGQEDGGQYEPQVLQTAVHSHLQVSPAFPPDLQLRKQTFSASLTAVLFL